MIIFMQRKRKESHFLVYKTGNKEAENDIFMQTNNEYTIPFPISFPHHKRTLSFYCIFLFASSFLEIKIVSP